MRDPSVQPQPNEGQSVFDVQLPPEPLLVLLLVDDVLDELLLEFVGPDSTATPDHPRWPNVLHAVSQCADGP